MRVRQLMQGLLCSLVLVQAVSAQQNLNDHPGFVDFSELDEIASQEPSVEISLKAPILNLITGVLRNSDEQAADFVSTLIGVNVRVFDSSRIDRARMADTMSAIAQRLDRDSWDRVIRVREGEEHVDVYFRLDSIGEMIHGIAIMVSEPGETVLVNIVGDISPEDISAIGARFDIDELSGIDFNAGSSDPD